MSTRREFLQDTGYGALAAFTGLSGVAEVGPAAISSSDLDSDIGSLYPFVKSQAVAGEFPLSFRQNEFADVAAWKRIARGKLLELLHYAPPPCDPKAETVERVDRGDYVQEKVYFNTTPDARVPAFVLVPKKARRPGPGIVALHDHGGFYFWGKEKLVELEGEHPVLTDFKREYYAGRSITKERIEAFNRRSGEGEQLVGRTIFSAGFTWAGVMFWDDVRTVDYLLTRPEVDPRRIGCVGLSVGGVRSAHLAALDDRVKAAVVVGWMTSFPAQLKRRVRNTIGHTKLVPGLYRYLDYPDVASLAMPTPLLVINGSKDELFEPSGVRASFEKLAACYQKAGVPERVRTRLYDAPHEFNREMQTEAWTWLARHLRP